MFLGSLWGFFDMEGSFYKFTCEKLVYLTLKVGSEIRREKALYSELTYAQILGISEASSWPETWRTCNFPLDLWPGFQWDYLIQVRNVNCQNVKITWLMQYQVVPLNFICVVFSWSPQSRDEQCILEMSSISQRWVLTPRQHIEGGEQVDCSTSLCTCTHLCTILHVGCEFLDMLIEVHPPPGWRCLIEHCQ